MEIIQQLFFVRARQQEMFDIFHSTTLSIIAFFPENIINRYFRVMVAFIFFCFPAILDAFLRAPLEACEALFTVTTPEGNSRFHGNVPHGADLFTDAAGVALALDIEVFVHSQNEIVGHLVDEGKNKPLPKGTLLYESRFSVRDIGRRKPDFFDCRIKEYLLGLLMTRPTPWNIVARQSDIEPGGKHETVPGQEFLELNESA